MRLRITKLAESPGGLPARDALDHIPGHSQPETFSLPIEYTVEGILMEPIQVGRSVLMERDTRNGVQHPGIFQTSKVTEVKGNTFRTLNSIYNFEVIKT